MVAPLDVENRRSVRTIEGMASAASTPGATEPVERFRPTSGQAVGNATLLAIVLAIGWVLLEERTLVGLRIATGLLFFGVLMWVTVLRPRATAYPGFLHIHNSVRDVQIPYAAIDEVTVGRVLSVWVGDRRHVCTGIGRPLRRVATSSRFGPRGPQAHEPASVVPISYADVVRSRIESMAADARRGAGDGTADARPRHVWAWPELIALTGTGAAFLLALLL